MDIRTFLEGDRQQIIELWEVCGLSRPWNNPDRDIDRKVQFQPHLFLVGTVAARVMASAMAGYDGHRGSVFYLAVHPDFQGLGHGQELVTHIETLLTGMGCPKLNIVIRSSNVDVVGFYNSLSYTQDDVVSLGKRLISDG